MAKNATALLPRKSNGPQRRDGKERHSTAPPGATTHARLDYACVLRKLPDWLWEPSSLQTTLTTMENRSRHLWHAFSSCHINGGLLTPLARLTASTACLSKPGRDTFNQATEPQPEPNSQAPVLVTNRYTSRLKTRQVAPVHLAKLLRPESAT